MLCTYIGSARHIYMDYVDAATGRTLEAEPGRTYDIQRAPGRHPGLAAIPGDRRWTAWTLPAPALTDLELPPPPDAGEPTTTEPVEGAATPESEG